MSSKTVTMVIAGKIYLGVSVVTVGECSHLKEMVIMWPNLPPQIPSPSLPYSPVLFSKSLL